MLYKFCSHLTAADQRQIGGFNRAEKVSLCFLLVIRAWCFAAPFIRCYIITGCHLCELLYDIMQHRANSLYNIDV